VTSSRAPRHLAASLVLGLSAALLVSPPSTAAPQKPHHGHHGHHHGGKVVWDSTSFYAGSAPVAAHGRVDGKRKVKLQVKLPGGWHTLASTKSSRKGKFSISAPLNWYGAHEVRISTSGKHRFTRKTTASVYMTYPPRGNAADRAFLNYQGVRYSFDPCKTVRYVVNTDDVGAPGLLLAQLAIAQVSWATGIEFQYVGASHQIPFQTDDTQLPAGQDLLVSFADQTEIPKFVTTPAIGFGGPVDLHAARDGAGRPVWETEQAAVVFNTNAWNDTATYDQSFAGTKPNWGETILHELGHAFGLDHAAAKDEIMYYQAGNGVWPGGYFLGLYDNGDLSGLATNGLGQGCFKSVRSFRTGAPAKIAAPKPLP
jgi:hypothetical protein